MIEKFIKTQNVGYLLGHFSDNAFHQHYAVQVVVSLNEAVHVQYDTISVKNEFLLIKSMHSHRLDCVDQSVLVLLINPASKLGHLLNSHSDGQEIQVSKKKWFLQLQKLALKWHQNNLTYLDFKKNTEISSREFIKLNKQCFHYLDRRIISALGYLRNNAGIIIPIEDIARQVFLSPSRFIHLFKKETGITYRRMQLWNKLMASIDDINNHKNITNLAHVHGFADSAHFSRTFKQTFGLNPKILIKYSQFIQL
jgi:AraC-like DNA-binding protein